MRHHDGGPAVAGGEAGDALRTAAGVGGVLLRRVAQAVHVAQRQQPLFDVAVEILVADFGAALTVGHGDRQARAGHVAQQYGRRVLDFHQRGARLELLAQVAHEVRPVLGAGDQILQVGQHLAAVTDPQREGVLAEEEAVEGVAQARVIENALGPALAGAQHVAVGEAAAGHQTFHVVQTHAAGEQVAHVHVHGAEPGAVEGGGHFHVTVNTLLAQDRHLGPGTGIDERAGHVLAHVESEAHVQARVVGIGDRFELLAGAVRVIAQRLDPVAGFRPQPLQPPARTFAQHRAAQAQAHHVLVVHGADTVHTAAQAGVLVALAHRLNVGGAHLDHRAGLLGEQRRHGFRAVAGDVVQHDVQAGAAGERHLRQGGEQAAVGAVVVGEQALFRQQPLGYFKEGDQVVGVVQIRRHITDLAEHLGQRRAGQAVLAPAQVDQQQFAVQTGFELRRGGQADVGDVGEAGDDQRQRRHHALVDAFFLPQCAHGQGVLAHRDGDAQLRAQFHAHRLDGFEQGLVLARVAGGGHPVGGQADLAQRADVGAGQVGEGFRHRHAAGGGRVDQRHRGALAHRHGFTGALVVTGGGHRAVGHRHLPGADHLIAVHQAGHRPVADGDQEILGGHRGQAHDPLDGVLEFDALGGERLALEIFPVVGALHFRRLAEQQVHGQVHRRVAEVVVGHFQVFRFGGLAEHRERRTLALAQRLEALQVLRQHRQHVAFLCFVAPDLHRAHARLGTGDGAQRQFGAPIVVVDQFRQGVGEAAGAHVVDRHNRIVLTQRPAAVDHFLDPAFDFRVVALHRGEIQRFVGFAAGHGTGGAAAQADQHGGAADHDDLGARRNRFLVHVAVTHVAQAAGDHDRLVVAAALVAGHARRLDFQGAEVTAQVGPAELIIESGAAQRPVDHDLQRRGDAPGATVVVFPGLTETGNAQVGHGKAGEARLGLAAAAGGALVADLAAGAGGRARARGDGGGMVVGLHLHQHVHRLVAVAVLTRIAGVARIRVEAVRHRAGHHRRVIAVGAEHALAGVFVGVADHGEQAEVLLLAVDGPVRVEDLVAAVLGVGLGEHHQLGVRGVAPQGGEPLRQVVDFILRQRQTQLTVGGGQRLAAAADHVHAGQRARPVVGEQHLGVLQPVEHRFHHAIVQRRRQLAPGRRPVELEPVFNTALHPRHLGEAGVVADVGGLGRPRRHRARARHHHEGFAVALFHGRVLQAGAVFQQAVEHLTLALVQPGGALRWRQLHEVHETGGQSLYLRQSFQQFFLSKRG